jgi:two-component system chemotaxis response regulator CheB
MPKRDIILVGGSAGSSAVLKQIMAGLPEGFVASLFITTHMATGQHSYLADLLADAGPMPVRRARDGQPVEPGHAYVAAPGFHLLLVESTIRLGPGPRENMARPAIDPMFRSAALSVGPRAVGVVLSGKLNDGASGLHAIKQQGGMAVVQHPVDAAEDDMPRAALESVEVDHVAPAAGLARLLAEIAATEAGPPRPPSDELLFEVEIAAGARLGFENLRRRAEPTGLTCPDCQGVLSQIQAPGPLRFRCQTGHGFTAEQLAAGHERLDEAIRVAMRIMEERLELVQRMGRDARERGRTAVAELYEARATEYRRYAETLRAAAVEALYDGASAD